MKLGRFLSVTAAAALTVAGPAGPAHAAGQTAPDLPTPAAGSCVTGSPVTVTGEPWAQRLLAPSAIWPVTRGRGVLVAVLDTGVSSQAPALRGAVRPGADVAGGRADSDCYGRGTALAGIVAARPVSGVGFAGMAPGADILPVRIVDRDGKMDGARIAAGIRAATAGGARVILVGTGVSTPSAALASAVEQAIRHDVVVVAAVSDTAATDTPPNPAPLYPAAYPDVLAVNDVDTDGTPVPVPATAGVDIAGPGAGAISIGPLGSGHYTVKGTAVAAAYVAGTAALVRAYHPSLTEAQIRQRLTQTSRPAPGGRRTSALGAGTLDAYAAVTALTPGQSWTPSPAAAAAAVTMPARPGVARSTWIALLTVLGAAVVTALVAGLALVAAPRHPRRRSP